MGKIRAPFRCLGRRRYERSTVDDDEREQEQGKRGQGPNVLTPQECETMGQIRFLGGRRYKRSIDDGKEHEQEQGKCGQGPSDLKPHECESLQVALENWDHSPQEDKQIVEEQVSRFWGSNKVAFLCLCAFSGKCTDDERDNTSLLLGSLREDHDLTEEGWQAFEDRMNLLKKPSFGGGPMIGYDMDTLDAMDPTVDASMDPTVDTVDLGDDNDENSDESSTLWSSLSDRLAKFTMYFRHNMTEEGWRAFEDRMGLLKKSSFGGDPMIGYDMDTVHIVDTVDTMDPTEDTSMDPTVDTLDSGDDNDEYSDESSTLWASLSARLAKDKNVKQIGSRPRTKSPREKRQEDAAVMKANQKASLGDGTKQHLFLAKYLGILLVKDNVTMIVTAATFSAARSMWLLTATTAKQQAYDNRIYIADTDCIRTVTIDVSDQRPGLATYIENFNGLNKQIAI
jgi:hypothetical protein